MKKIFSIIITLVLLLTLVSQALAYSYTNEFSEYYGVNGTATARSPFHIGNADSGADNYTLPDHRVNGPNNQPRYVGYNDLHNATDFRAASGTNVYPMFKAKVIKFYRPGTVNNGYVIVQYDIDNNGTWDDYYAKYTHILPRTDIDVGDTFDTNERIGEIDIKRGDGWSPHLDLKDTNSSGSRSIKLFRYYRGVKNWGYGYYLDYFAGDAIVDGKLYISVNSMDEGTNAPPEPVEFYYKIGSTGDWKKGPNMSLYLTGNSSGDYYRYIIDLKSATGASSGDLIFYYLAAIRTNGTVSSTYNWGLWPQYYKMPEKKPADIIADGETPITEWYYVQ